MELLIIVTIAMVMDVVSGVSAAVRLGNVESVKMREGLWHKAGFVGLIAMAYLLEYGASLVDLGMTVPAVNAVCVFVVITEAMSIFENLCILNPAIADSPFGGLFAGKGDE